MDFSKYSHIFMLGIGGIGMSGLARYFRHTGKPVAGYDRTRTRLTDDLENEGIAVIFTDDPAAFVPDEISPEKVLVIYTPAIQRDNRLFLFFAENNYTMVKRAQVLGAIASQYRTIAVAGTHGKTSTSTLIAHILNESKTGCTALLGGISKNHQTNFLFSEDSPFLVTEADEFDRSFLQLNPFMAAITAVDADHLDIYGSHEELLKTYAAFAKQVEPGGLLLVKKGIELILPELEIKNLYSYAFNNPSADIYASHIDTDEHKMRFDLNTPQTVLHDLTMLPIGLMNIENAVAATFLALQAGVDETVIRTALAGFNGVRRRFDVRFNNGKLIYIDDYAHHPEEINALLKAVKTMFPSKKITGIFQPHLYSRTRDFADEFAQSLEQLDEVILTGIYPAREKPIEGVSSELILSKIRHDHKCLMTREQIPNHLLQHDFEVLLTIGAGNIDALADPLLQMLYQKTSQQEIP